MKTLLIMLITTWDAVFDADIYEVEYYKCFSPYGYAREETVENHSLLTTYQDTVYAARVRACNINGCGVWEYSDKYRLEEDELEDENTKCVFIEVQEDLAQ